MPGQCRSGRLDGGVCRNNVLEARFLIGASNLFEKTAFSQQLNPGVGLLSVWRNSSERAFSRAGVRVFDDSIMLQCGTRPPVSCPRAVARAWSDREVHISVAPPPWRRYHHSFAIRHVRRDREAGADPVRATPKAQPARKRSGRTTAGSRELWRAIRRLSPGSTEGVRRSKRLRPISQVTGQRGDRRRPVASYLSGRRVVRWRLHRRS